MKKAKAGAKPKMTPMPEGSTLKVAFLPDGEIEARMYGARVSAAKACTFCKRPYIKPCSDKTKDSCPNFMHLQSRSKKR